MARLDEQDNYGGIEESRTPDFFRDKEALFQLSYDPETVPGISSRLLTDPTPPPSELWIEDHWTPILSRQSRTTERKSVIKSVSLNQNLVVLDRHDLWTCSPKNSTDPHREFLKSHVRINCFRKPKAAKVRRIHMERPIIISDATLFLFGEDRNLVHHHVPAHRVRYRGWCEVVLELQFPPRMPRPTHLNFGLFLFCPCAEFIG